MNEQESKARLIAKRIALTLTKDLDSKVGSVWRDLADFARNNWIGEWTEIAKEALGEEAEPESFEMRFHRLYIDHGARRIMRAAAMEWGAAEPEEALAIGPRLGELVSCDCDDEPCPWCCGTRKVTRHVRDVRDTFAQTLEEQKRKRVEQAKEEPRRDWNSLLFHTGWTEGFVERMRERGATRVEVPVDRDGSIRVDFAIDRSGRVQRKCQNPECGKLTELLLYDIADAPEKWSCAHCGAWNEPGLVMRKPTLEPEDPGDKEAERQRKE